MSQAAIEGQKPAQEVKTVVYDLFEKFRKIPIIIGKVKGTV